MIAVKRIVSPVAAGDNHIVEFSVNSNHSIPFFLVFANKTGEDLCPLPMDHAPVASGQASFGYTIISIQLLLPLALSMSHLYVLVASATKYIHLL